PRARRGHRGRGHRLMTCALGRAQTALTPSVRLSPRPGAPGVAATSAPTIVRSARPRSPVTVQAERGVVLETAVLTGKGVTPDPFPPRPSRFQRKTVRYNESI